MGLAYSPDGKGLLTWGWRFKENSYRACLHETLTGTPIREYRTRGIRQAVLSPDGVTLAYCTGGHPEVYLVNLCTGEEITRLKGHTGNVFALAFSPDGHYLASGSADTTVLLWYMGKIDTGLRRRRLSAAQLDRAWRDLSVREAKMAYPALWSLRQAGPQAIEFLARRLQPILPVDKALAARLIAQLDSNDFASRESATRKLEDLAPALQGELTKALANKPSAEAKKRLEKLLAICRPPFSGGSEPRALRGVQILEGIGTRGARALLQRIAEGEPTALLTREARAALQRMKKRSAQ
jgi:hypothetical protein